MVYLNNHLLNLPYLHVANGKSNFVQLGPGPSPSPSFGPKAEH